MPASAFCHKFLRESLASTHQYRRNALTDMTISLTRGASLNLTSIGRSLAGDARVKHKIKRVDRLMGNAALHREVPALSRDIICWLIRDMKECVIAVDWSAWPTQSFSLLRASLLADGRAIPLLSLIAEGDKLGNPDLQNRFLDDLAGCMGDRKVTLVTDAGFRREWFNRVQSHGWHFIGRLRGNGVLKLAGTEEWVTPGQLKAGTTPRCAGAARLTRYKKSPAYGFVHVHKRAPKNRHGKKSRDRFFYTREEANQSRLAREPWVLFTSDAELKPRTVMKLYSRRMQIEQNFRDEKSERYGMGLRSSFSRSVERMSVLNLLSTLCSILLWLMGYALERKGEHRFYQANTVQHRRVLSYLTLARNAIRHNPAGISQLDIETVRAELSASYRNIVYVY